MRRILEKYNIFEERILVISLVLNVLIVFLQIIMRSIFNMSISWSEELSRYIFIWQIWLGVSIAYNYDQHLKVDLIYNIFHSKRAHRIIKISVNLIWLAFNIFLLIRGVELLRSMQGRHASSSGMRLPLVYVYGVLPFSSFIVSLRILLDIFDILKGETSETVKRKV
ncbi:MAG: TRAP transporter small permease [Tissierellia bacterium]|nr:TRAP transporter small permease [Tissierellia bacterium]